MMHQVNLLPAEYRRRRARSRQLRFWMTLSGSVLAAQVGLAICLGYMAHDARAARGQIDALQAKQGDLTKTLAALTAQDRALARRLALTERLQQKHRRELQNARE